MGGIIPFPDHDSGDEDDLCLYCNQGYGDHAVLLYDSVIHRECIEPFLGTDAGRRILNRGYEVIRARPDGEWETLYPQTDKARLYSGVDRRV